LTIKAAAEKAGLARQNLSELVHHNENFQRALEARRGEAFHAGVARLRRLSSEAIAILERAMNGAEGAEIPSSAISAAVGTLKLCGLHKARIPLDGFDLSDLDRGRSMRTAFDSIGEMLKKESEASDGGGDDARG
jgi:hypothetical protein